MDVRNPAGNAMCQPVQNLQAVLGLPQDPNSESWVIIDACVLVAWLVFYRVLVYIALRWKTASH